MAWLAISKLDSQLHATVFELTPDTAHDMIMGEPKEESLKELTIQRERMPLCVHPN